MHSALMDNGRRIGPTLAIIDRGINKSLDQLKACTIEEVKIAGHQVGDATHESPSQSDLRSHGSNIACIITEMISAVHLVSIELCGNKSVNVEQLCEALEYCNDREDITVINISLGILTDQPNERLRAICQKSVEMGKHVVASAHFNSDKKCYPAGFESVYGVGVGLLERPDDFCYQGEGYINILAKGVYRRLLGPNYEPVVMDGTSYATAAFSAILFNRIKDNKSHLDKMTLNDWLISNSVNCQSLHYPVKLEDNSLNRPTAEINTSGTWLMFPKDDRRLLNQGKKNWQNGFFLEYPTYLSNVTEIKTQVKSLKGMLSPKIFTKIDTLIIGNFMTNEISINRLFGLSLLDLGIQHSVNFIVLDEFIMSIIHDKIQSSEITYRGGVHLA